MHQQRQNQSDVGARRLTDADVAVAFDAVKQAQKLRDAMQARRDGQLLPESWPEIREAREERADRI